jgi:hypothetical protein
MSVQELAEVANELPESLQQYVETPEEKTAEQPTETPVEEVAEVKADPIVDKARQGGWRPKEEWDGDPDQWVDAKEFVSRKPLFDKIHALNKALKDKDEKIKTVSEYATKAFQKGQEKAIKELEEQRRQAVESGDLEAFEAADKELQEVRKEQPVAPQQPDQPEIPPVIQEFAKRNDKWFEKDKAMTVFMVEQTKEYTAGGLALEAAMEKAEADVKREFAHKFENPNKQKPAAVSTGNTEARAKSYTYADLNAGQRSVWNAMKKTPGYTFEDYVADLKAQGDLK